MGHSLNPGVRVVMVAAVVLFAAVMSAYGQGMHDMKNKHAAGAGVASLDAYIQEGVIHLLIGEDVPGQPTALRYLQSADGGEHWTQPVGVNQGGSAVYARRGMDPQIAAFGKNVVAVWTTLNDNKYGRGPMATAISSDGGKTWRPGPNPADDHSKTDHGMIDIAADVSGTFHLAWLDARNGQKGLIYARSTDGGQSWSANQTLCPRTCECCWNTITTAPDGTVAVLYRQLEADSIRDMGLLLSQDGGKTWGAPQTVGEFNWKINGCAHCGGGLVFMPRPDGQYACHAVVWTGDKPGVFVLNATDGGRHWEAPHSLGDETAFHPDEASGSDGQLAVVWDAQRDNRSVILAACSLDYGRTWSRPVQLSAPQTSATHPRILWTGKIFRVFWTQRIDSQPAVWTSRQFPAP